MTLPLAALLQGAAATPPVGEGAAGAVDLDGQNDYFSRASDFTGNADGKTFTFSAWVVNVGTSQGFFYANADGYFALDVTAGSGLRMRGYNSSGVQILDAAVTSFNINVDQYTDYNILVSLNLGNSGQRSIYINDVAQTVTWTTYTNDNIDFTRTLHRIGASGTTSGAGQLYKGRLAHVFLDYSYRDISVEANRRYFITADRKPAASSATLTSGIMYFPMGDPTTAHINLGTGGNFTLNGVVARSGRGPNQYNVAYSDLDGSADYVSKTGALLGSGSKTITFSCAFNPDSVTTDQYLFGFWTSVTTIAQIFGVYIGADGSFGVLGQVSPGTGTYILNAGSAAGVLKAGRNYTLQISIDLSDTGKRFVYLNGEAVSMTWTTYTDDYIYLNQASNSPITSAGRSRTFYFNGRLGNVFFHTSYIDLSNAANLAKFVTGTGIDAKPVDMGANGELPLGVTPLIYLPMYGNNAGKNYGSGGDFTVNSGPYPGARGPNEFWGNKADFDGTTGYLSRTSALTGVSDGKTFSCSFVLEMDALSGDLFFAMGTSTTTANRGVVLHLVSGGSYRVLDVYAFSSSGTEILNARLPTNLVVGTSYSIQVCVDLSNTSNRAAYINGTAVSVTWNTYTNNDVAFTTATNMSVGRNPTNFTNLLNGKLSELYFTTDYIDFSQEANRLLFRDAFGNPTDLPAAITAGIVPNPAIYMRFDPANQGLNSGTGGNFTKSGTITDAGNL